MATHPPDDFRLGPWRVSPRQLTLESGSQTRRLEPRVMDVLVELARTPGQVISREALLESVWGTVHLTDDALSRCVSLLRKALDDDPRSPRFVETIPRRGYRLVAEVQAFEPAPPGAPASPAVAAGNRRRRPGWVVPVALGGLGLLVLLLGYGLRPGAPTAPRSYDSIAVLAFENHSHDDALDYLSDGIAEEVLNLLAEVPGLKVVGRTSAFAFKGSALDLPEVASRLNVGTLLRGSLSRSDEQLRVWVQLVDDQGVQLFSNSYLLPLGDVFQIEESIARSTFDALRLAALLPDQRPEPSVRSRPAVDSGAHLAYLQGMALWNHRGEKSLRRGLELFETARRIDPGYAQPVLGLAKAYAVLPFYSDEPREAAFARAQQAARLALALDERLGEAHAVLGFTHMHQWQWSAARAAFEQARRLNPNDATIHQWYAQFLAEVGFARASLASALAARDLDPISPAVNDRLATAYLWLNDDARAAEHFALANDLGFDRSSIHESYILLLWRRGQLERIAELLERLQRRLGLSGQWARAVVRGLRNPAALQAALPPADGEVRMDPVPASFLFGAAVLVEQFDAAYALVDILVESRALIVEFLFSPEASGLRADPRFARLLERIGLLDYWRANGWPSICEPIGRGVRCD